MCEVSLSKPFFSLLSALKPTHKLILYMKRFVTIESAALSLRFCDQTNTAHTRNLNLKRPVTLSRSEFALILAFTFDVTLEFKRKRTVHR